MQILRLYKIFLFSLSATAIVVAVKYLMHILGWELITQTSLHNSIISSVIFVIGFILSATIADYKESEKIPAEFASTIQDIYDDARSIHKTYPKFDLVLLHKNLLDILSSFRVGTRVKRTRVRKEIGGLHESFSQMEKAGVPPNFVVKLKQQQAQLLKSLFRVNYIQRIRFIPSATYLVRSLVLLVIAFVLLTDIDPFYGGLVITGILSFILIYMLFLIQTVSVPFRAKGETQDDVSLFLIRETTEYLNEHSPKIKNSR